MIPLSYLSPKAAVRHRPIHGRGLLAAEPIPLGDIVALTGGSLDDRARRHRLPPALASADIPIAEGLFIGPLREDEREGAMRFSHHAGAPTIGKARSCSPPCETCSRGKHGRTTGPPRTTRPTRCRAAAGPPTADG